MAIRTWTLTDVERDQNIEELSLGADELIGAAEGSSITKRTLRGGLGDGVDVVEIDNGVMKFAILPTRGMGIWKGWLGDRPIGWKSPVGGPVHPKFVPITEASGLGWLDGFDELLCRCGLTSNGAPEFGQNGALLYPLHGRIANLPAQTVDVGVDADTGELSVTGVVEETRFLFHKLRLTSTVKMLPGEMGLRIEDTVSNHSDRPGQMQLLYHVNFGRPLLDPGARIVAPFETVVPRDEQAARGIGDWTTYGSEQPDFAEQVYFCRLAADETGQTRATLVNAQSDWGVSLRFSVHELPCFTLWKNTAGGSDGYVTGMEPGVNYPNVRSFEQQQGRVVSLAPGEGRRFELAIEVHSTPEGIVQALAAIARIQGDRQPTIYEAPQPGWCAL